MDLGVLSLACLYAIDVVKSMFCTTLCALLYFWCTYAALLESGSVGVCGLEIKTREDLADKQDKTSHLMNCPWCPQGVPSLFSKSTLSSLSCRGDVQILYLPLRTSFLFAAP